MKHLHVLSKMPMRAEDSTAVSAKIDFWTTVFSAYGTVATSKETSDS